MVISIAERPYSGEATNAISFTSATSSGDPTPGVKPISSGSVEDGGHGGVIVEAILEGSEV
jgi:hypothetical protein